MDSVGAQAEGLQHILNYAGKGLGAVTKTKLGNRIFGIFSYPLLGARAIAEKQAKEFDDYGEIALTQEDQKKDELSPLEKIRKTIIERFAIGDLVSIAGLGMYLIQNSLGPQKPGILGGLIRNASLLATFFGSSSAAIGRALGFDKEFLYGEEHAWQMLRDAEAKSKPIFKIIDGSKDDHKLKINEYIKNAAELKRTLIYKDVLSQSILERHAQNRIGGFFDGPPGTGKTKGVECVIGNWAQKVIKEGDIPVIAELNLANFDEYVATQKQKQMDAIELFEYITNDSGNTRGNFATNQGLMVLELLIRTIQKIKANVEKYNANSQGPKKRFVVFADEFDKAFQARTLKGCDKQRLRNLLVQFNELFVKDDLLLTSNTKLEKLMKELEDHVKIDDQNTGKEEIIDPTYDRLKSQNRALIEFPAAKEQALILSSRILEDFPGLVDWQDFATGLVISGNFEQDRERFAEVIEAEITSKYNTKMNGRHLFNACEQLKSMLLAQANKIYSQNKFVDDASWESLSLQDKLKRTGVKINKTMLLQVIYSKLENVNLNQSQKDFDFALNLVDEYLKKKSIAKNLKDRKLNFKAQSAQEFEDILSLVYNKFSSDGNTVFLAKEPVRIGNNDYHHIVTKYLAQGDEEATYNFAFTVLNGKSQSELTMHNFINTKRISEHRFKQELNPRLEKGSENVLTKTLNTLINSVKTDKSGNLLIDESSLKNITQEVMDSLHQAA